MDAGCGVSATIACSLVLSPLNHLRLMSNVLNRSAATLGVRGFRGGLRVGNQAGALLDYSQPLRCAGEWRGADWLRGSVQGDTLDYCAGDSRGSDFSLATSAALLSCARARRSCDSGSPGNANIESPQISVAERKAVA